MLNALMHQQTGLFNSSGRIDSTAELPSREAAGMHPPTGLVLLSQVPASWKARRSARPVMVGLIALLRTNRILA